MKSPLNMLRGYRRNEPMFGMSFRMVYDDDGSVIDIDCATSARLVMIAK